MPLQAAADVPLNIRSETSASERRISPLWSIAQLKARLEPITGVPPGSQRLTLLLGGSHPVVPIEAADEDATQLQTFPLQPYAEINVADTRPAAMRHSLTDTSTVEKYTMPSTTYEALPNTVQSYKRAHKIGRFDPTAPSQHAQQLAHIDREIAERRIAVGARCRLLPAETDARRGEVAYVGPVEGLPGVEGGKWVGVRLDEPVGKNDGRGPGGTRYFDAGGGEGVHRGVFVRPEKLEVGDFDILDELGEEMEEL